jgi:hypothetical protein
MLMYASTLSRTREGKPGTKNCAPEDCQLEKSGGFAGDATDYELRHAVNALTPARVSIITTVYNRVECLKNCIRSVQGLNFKDYEHIIVADSPRVRVLRRIERLVRSHDVDSGKLTLASLKSRKNDWGISPARVGLTLARGKYICFLSDDNGYLSNHFDKLVSMLDTEPSIGFAYTSCLYAGRRTLCAVPPRAGSIDLGQPLFRRELFDRYLAGTIPFHEFCWDWRMIETFMRNGVRWEHLGEATFIFRLAEYPHLMAYQPIEQQP